MGVKEDIDVLESKIATLKVNYEQYFMRVLRREPLTLRGEVEKIILKYSNIPITNTMIKFRFNALVSKYNAYRHYWTRVLREIEEGIYEKRAEGGGAVIASAKLISLPTPKETAKPSEEVLEEPPDKDTAEKIYGQYIDMKKKCNEPTNGISLDTFKKSLDEQKKKLKETRGIEDIDLKVYIKDGKAKIALTPKK